MADHRPTPPIGPLAAAHERHDLLLVAAWASDDLDGAARRAADELVAGCSGCADLAADLRALARATHDLPPADRPRDYFLTTADAERLRPRGLRRLLAAFAAPTAPIRPLATGLTTLGVAGLLLAALPGILPLGGAASMPLATVGQSFETDRSEATDRDVEGFADGSAAPAAASPGDALFASPAPTVGSDTANVPPAATPDAPTTTAATNAGSAPGDESGRLRDAADTGPSALAIWSAIALVAGVALFAIRRLAARAR